MGGLAEILQENERLRAFATERHQFAEAQQAAFEQSLRQLTEHQSALQEKDRQLAEHQSALQEKDRQLAKSEAEKAALIAKAEELAKELERIRLGRKGPKSERHVPSGQEAFPFLKDIAPPPRLPVAEDTKPAPEPGKDRGKPGGKKPKRRNRQDLAHLEGCTVRCKAASDATCQRCGQALVVIGQAESFRCDWVPGHFVRHDVVRDKCACPNCPGQGVLTVPGPYALDRALCANGLLAKVIVDKYADHIPLHRQAKRLRRKGLSIGTNTLANWVCKGADLLHILAKSIRAQLMQGSFIQADDTGFPVQDAGNGSLRKGRLWVFTDQTQAFYAFTPTKEGIYPTALLRGFKGHTLLADGGSEFNQTVKVNHLRRSGCWAHLRRYFIRAKEHHPAEAELALGTIADLFEVERSLREKPPDQVLATRQHTSKPLVDGFFRWVQALSTVVRPTSTLGKAVKYAMNQKTTMECFLSDPNLPMHNNLSELMLRQAVVGRKNWLFARSEGGAKAASTLYTLVASCMLQGIDPHTYLVDVLGKIQDYLSTRVHELTPKAWAKTQPQENHHTTTA